MGIVNDVDCSTRIFTAFSNWLKKTVPNYLFLQRVEYVPL